MCGIAGYLNFVDRIIDNKKISQLTESIKHRGPDNNNYWSSKDRKVVLINTRLAIQDLSNNGNQPFLSQDGRYLIVFNGEIYNFKSLRENLKEFKFKSNSDTEVLLNLFIKYNKKCLELLEGMFAFAIYDKKKKELFCARDIFGVKPFYYFFDEKKFCFSSEIKTFINIGFNLKPNKNSVLRYLESEYYDHQTETFYKDIFKLKPGSYLVINQYGKKIEKKFFSFDKEYKKIVIPKKDMEKKDLINFLIEKSVKKSLVSDVPISVATSGGLDSSVLLNSLRNFGEKTKLISFIFDDQKFSEEKFVKKIASKKNYNCSFTTISPKNFKDNIFDSVKILEEPFAGLPIISYLLCIKKLAKTKVILDGSGLDEANCGYDKYMMPNSKKNNLIYAQDGSISVQKNIIHSYLKQRNNSDVIPRPFEENFKNEMFSDLFFLKLPRALRFRDKLSMAYGKEIRPCFLDKELILTLLKLDTKYHHKDGFGKRILRDIYKNDISSEIAFTKKRNIQTPQTEWFRNEMSSWLDRFVSNATIWDLKWIDKKEFLIQLDLFKRKKIHNSFFIWKLINLEIWSKIH